MKKILLVAGALILLSIVFYLGVVVGSGTEQENQEDTFEYVENDSSSHKISSQDLHDLKAMPNVIILAKMMIEEKKANRLNDAPYMAYIVDSLGFALETNDEEVNAKKKLEKKNLDFIVLNSLQNKGTCFQSDENQISIISKEGQRDYEKKSKQAVARDIVDEIEKRVKG